MYIKSNFIKQTWQIGDERDLVSVFLAQLSLVHYQ